jgi:hypothetical protein
MHDYSAQIDTLEADELMVRADLAYLRAILASDAAEQTGHLQRARQLYRRAIPRYEYVDLKYYTPGEVAQKYYPKGMSRENVEELIDDPVRLNDLYTKIIQGIDQMSEFDQNEGERDETRYFIKRAFARLAEIDKALGAAPSSQPATK